MDYDVYFYNRVTEEQEWYGLFNEESDEHALERGIIELQEDKPHSHLDWDVNVECLSEEGYEYE